MPTIVRFVRGDRDCSGRPNCGLVVNIVYQSDTVSVRESELHTPWLAMATVVSELCVV